MRPPAGRALENAPGLAMEKVRPVCSRKLSTPPALKRGTLLRAYELRFVEHHRLAIIAGVRDTYLESPPGDRASARWVAGEQPIAIARPRRTAFVLVAESVGPAKSRAVL
jgi:hypothetical protein